MPPTKSAQMVYSPAFATRRRNASVNREKANVNVQLLAAEAARERVVITPALDKALAALDAELESLAPELQVEYIGPGVGVEGKEDVYRLVVRPHEWAIHEPSWSLKVCDALPNADWRAAWAVQGVSRARKAEVVRKLPEFMREYAERIREAGKAETAAGRRVQELAAALSAR